MSKNCLVVGANGFIASHLVDRLVEQGYQVKAFDRYGRPPQFKDLENPNLEIIKGDILLEPDIYSAIDGMDYVFHSFSATTPFSSENDPYSDINLNLLPLTRFFNACAERQVKKVIYLSSGGAIYGKTAENKVVSEDDLPLPVSPYGICKLAAENYLSYFNRKHGLNYLVFRVTNPYGPRQLMKHNQGVIPAFMDKIKRNEQITVYGDGSSSRDFIHVTDVVTMITQVFTEDTKYNTYNIGSGSQTSVKEILASIEKAYGSKLSVEYLEAPKTFLQKADVSIERYWNEFGKPDDLISLDDGVSEIVSQI
jgi:UDP-glucose 4-epimerase